MLHPTKNENGEIDDVSALDAVLHFFSIGWKVLFATCPPPHIWGGWLTFFAAIIYIGCLTYLMEEFAYLFGCVIGLKTQATALIFVSAGTSMPDLFASRLAAVESRYADAALANVLGSNSVNVFLGLGIPWLIGSVYAANKAGTADVGFRVPNYGLDLTIAAQLATTLLGLTILIIRRIVVKGELGGGTCGRWFSAILMISLWGVFVAVSVLGIYGKISLSGL